MRNHTGRRVRKAAGLAGVVLSGSLLLAACGGNDDAASDEQSAPAEAETSATDDTTSSPDEGQGGEESQGGPLTASDAVARALEEVPGGAVVEMERGREGLAKVWDIDVLGSDGSGTNLYLAVEDGAVVERESTRLTGLHRTAPELPASDAIDAALGAVPGSVQALDLGRERGRTVWEAQVRADDSRGWEVYVDAATGEIVKQERD